MLNCKPLKRLPGMPELLKRVLAALFAALLALPAGGGAPPAQSAQPPRPKLIVLIMVDQMRADYITTYGHQWSKGLRRLLDQGAWFTEAAYPYLNTITCAGHATVSTGALPYQHGMILNSWWNRAAEKNESCTGDRETPLTSYGAELKGGESARHLRARTLAQELRDHFGQEHARVASFSRKARSAILLAGPEADAVAWLEDNRTWTTSAAYPLQAFLRTYIHLNPIERDIRREWRLSLKRSKYLYRDAEVGERPQPPQWTERFPHRLRNRSLRPDSEFYAAWVDSPYADEYLTRLARQTTSALNLGRGGGTDLLAISYSALDGVGHDFGPRSFEVQDTMVRLDASIGGLLDYLDGVVGKDNYTVALTADHGVAGVPEQVKSKTEEAGRVSSNQVIEAARKVLEKHFGGGRHVATSLYTDFYFTNGTYEHLLANPAVLDEVIAAIQNVPGVARVFRGDQLPGRRDSPDPVERAAALSYFPGRSGDLILIPEQNWFFVMGRARTVATHGTAHPYDARVPLIFYGAGIRPGKYAQPATPADIAPTLAAMAGITMTEATGRVLHEALGLPEKNQLARPDSLLDSPK